MPYIENEGVVHSLMREWRSRALGIVLIVVAITSTPAYLSVGLNTLRSGGIAPQVWVYIMVYALTVILAIFRRIDFSVRAWGLVAISYANAAASFARLGIVGSGRLWLVALPVIAAIIIGSRAGVFTAAFSAAIYGSFMVMAWRGVLGAWIVRKLDPMAMELWSEGGTALLVFLATLVLLVDRFARFHIRTITERGYAEGALKEAYEIINRSPAVAFLWKNEEGWPVEFVSENVRALFGYTVEDFQSGKTPYGAAVHPEDLGRVAREVAELSGEREREDHPLPRNRPGHHRSDTGRRGSEKQRKTVQGRNRKREQRDPQVGQGRQHTVHEPLRPRSFRLRFRRAHRIAGVRHHSPGPGERD
jgi:PAS domain-containing protein